MKFEKVSVEEFARSVRGCMKPGETERMFQEKVTYFKDKLTVPKRSTGGSAGYDFICPFDIYIKPGEIAKIPTGVKVELDTFEYAKQIRSNHRVKDSVITLGSSYRQLATEVKGKVERLI